MGKLYLSSLLFFIVGILSSVNARTIGDFKNYRQLTDKEVLIETTRDACILVTAYNHYALGVTVLSAHEAELLTSPDKIHLRTELSGSIYVEELDELMQITTTVSDGIVIKIEKEPLRLSYINKADNALLFEEEKGVKFGNKETETAFSIGAGEHINLVAGNHLKSISQQLGTGEIYTNETVDAFLFEGNDICVVSSKGYAVVLEADQSYQIDLSKKEQLKISHNQLKANKLEYLILYGQQQPEMIEKYAFHVKQENKQMTQR